MKKQTLTNYKKDIIDSISSLLDGDINVEYTKKRINDKDVELSFKEGVNPVSIAEEIIKEDLIDEISESGASEIGEYDLEDLDDYEISDLQEILFLLQEDGFDND